MKLLVLILRGLHAGAIGPYGNRWIDTPTLDALATSGVVFDWHFAAHPDPAGADRAWRSGCYSFPQPDGSQPGLSRPDVLALLAERGISTRLIRESGTETEPTGWGSVVCTSGLDDALSAARAALAELTGERPGLVWVELSALLPPWKAIPLKFVDPYFTPPAPPEEEDDEEEEEIDDSLATGEEEEEEEPLDPNFDPPPGEIEEDDDDILSIQTTYAAAVTWVDSALGGLLAELPDDISVLLTADRGQALGEHGVVGPVRPWLHEEIVHVPLILYGPLWRPGLRVAALTQSVDLAPTLAELFGVALGEVHGRSLLPLIGLEERSLREYACMGLRCGERIEWALRSREWALLLPTEGEPRLYIKPDDRCEVNNVAGHHQEYTEVLAQTLRAFVTATVMPGPLVSPPLPALGDEQGGGGPV